MTSLLPFTNIVCFPWVTCEKFMTFFSISFFSLTVTVGAGWITAIILSPVTQRFKDWMGGMKSPNSHDKHWEEKIGWRYKGIDRHLSFNGTNKHSSVAIVKLGSRGGNGGVYKIKHHQRWWEQRRACLMIPWERDGSVF